MRSYRASLTREGEWYVIDVEGVGATQARRLTEVGSTLQDMMRAVLGDVEWLDDYTIEWISKEEA